MSILFFSPKNNINSIIVNIGKIYNIDKTIEFKKLLKSKDIVILFTNSNLKWIIKIVKFRLRKNLPIFLVNENESIDTIINSIKMNKTIFFSKNVANNIKIKNYFYTEKNLNLIINYNKNINLNINKNIKKLFVYIDNNDRLIKNINFNNNIKICNTTDFVQNIINADVIVFDKMNENINLNILINKLNKIILCRKENNVINILGKNYPGYYKNIIEINDILDYLYYRKIKNEEFYFDFIKPKKVLFISNDILWNSYCGNSVWATNFIKILNKRNNINFDVAICRKMPSIEEDNIFANELNFCNFINLINNTNNTNNIRKTNSNILLKESFIIKYINKNVSNYDYIIIRGVNLIMRYFNNFSSASKSKIIYIQMQKEKKNQNLIKVKRIHMTFLEYFKRKNEKDAFIIPPLIEGNIKIDKRNKIYDFCYVGTFHNDSGIMEVCNYFLKYKKLKIIFAGKILLSFQNEFEIIKNKFKDCKNIIFNVSKIGISKDICDNIISQSKIGIRIDDLFECLSSKILTYVNFEIPIILQRTTTHEKLFGEDYPFFLPRKKIITSEDFENLFKKEINIDKVISKIVLTKKILNSDNLIKNNYKLLI